MADSCEPTDEVRSILRAMAKNRVEAGITDPVDLVDAIHLEIKDHTGLLKSEIADIVSGFGQARKPRKDEIQARLSHIKAELRADARRVEPERHVEPTKASKDSEQAIRDRLQQQIDAVERQIKAGPDRSQPATVDTSGTAALKDRLQKLRDKLDSMKPATSKPRTTDAERNERRQTQLKKEVEDLQRKLSTGDFSAPDKFKPLYDEKTLTLELERDKVKRKVDKALYRIQQKNQSQASKITGTALAVRRAIILSSFHTIAKLLSAATMRTVSTPIEDLIAGAIAKTPGMGEIAEASQRLGSFDLKAQVQAMKAAYSKQTLLDMWQTARTGSGPLDDMFGAKVKGGDHPVLDFVGQLHGALKTTAKRHEFFLSLETRANRMRKTLAAQGVEPAEIDRRMKSPLTLAVLGAKAYEDAQRAIFMNDNGAVNAYRSLLTTLRNTGKEGDVSRTLGRAAANTVEYELPIVKIPTNYVAEATSYLAGAFKAAGQAANIHSQRSQAKKQGKARPAVSEEQADYILRNLSKQSVGAALLALGWILASNADVQIGGYYQPGEHRSDKDPEVGGMRIFGHNVPQYLLHNPAMEMLQFGATMHRIAQKMIKDKKTGQETPTGNTRAAVETTKDLFSEIPFFDQPARLVEQMHDADSISGALGANVRDALVPPDVQRFAKATDSEQALKRKPHGFIQNLESGIPGLRENVDVGSYRNMSLDQRLDAYDKMSQDERERTDMAKHILDSAKRHKNDLTDDQIKRLDAL